jgi:hypothetical protein
MIEGVKFTNGEKQELEMWIMKIEYQPRLKHKI